MAGDGCVNFIVTIDGQPDLMGELAELLAGLRRDAKTRLVVVKNPGACPQCVANEDPLRVPLHPNCRCKVREVTDNDRR